MLSCSPPALWSCLTPAVRVPCPSQHSFLFTAPGELTPSSTHSRNCKHTICSTSSRETANTACLQTHNSPWNTTSISHLKLNSKISSLLDKYSFAKLLTLLEFQVTYFLQIHEIISDFSVARLLTTGSTVFVAPCQPGVVSGWSTTEHWGIANN